MQMPPSTKSGVKPVIKPLFGALSSNTLSISTAMLNKIGDKGSPCLKPFLVGKENQFGH